MRCILLFLLLTSYGNLFAADTLQYSIRHYTDENGLPQNSVKHIAPDKSGFIWLGTENGLVRFDGQQFKQFNRSNIDISESRIFHILPGIDPRYLYASTRDQYDRSIRLDRGKAVVDYHYEHPSLYFMRKFNIKSGLAIYSLAGYPDIYISTADYYIIPIDSNNIFAITKNHVELYSGEGKKFALPLPNVFPKLQWRFFRLEENLFALKNLEAFAIINGQFIHTGKLKGDIEQDPLYGSPSAQPEIYWNMSAGEVFIFLSNNLYTITPGLNGKLTTRLLLSGFDLPHDRIASVYYDAAHERIFLGSYTKGLFILERKKFITVRSGRTEGDENYYAQTQLTDSSVLTSQGEVLGFSTSRTIWPIKEKINFQERNTILTDAEGNIWTKQKQTVYKFNRDGSKLLQEWQLPEPVTQLYIELHQQLWIGTENSVYRLNLLSEDPIPEKIADSLPYVTYLQQESPDIFWIGTNWGLHKLNIHTRGLTFIPELQGIVIRSLYCPRANEVWITTYETGFYLYTNNKLISFPQDKNHFLLASHCIVEDKQGYFWIPTNKGLFQAARKDLVAYANGEQQHVYYLYYSKEYGFGTNEFNGGCQPCALQLKNGNISLPSLNGLVWFNPASVRVELPDKELVIGEAQVDQKPLAANDTIALGEKFRQLKLFLYTPYFGDENNVQIEFALTGNGTQPVWLPVNRDNTVTLSSLPSGTHTLMIRKLNGFGRNNFNFKKIFLVVPPAFYETGWFRVGVVLLIIAGVFIYTRLRLRATRRKNKLLEMHVTTRTQELQTTLTALTHSEKKLRQQMHLQDNLIAAITHDIKSPLKYMAITARHVHHELSSTEQMQKLKSNTKVLYNAAHRMYHLTDNMLQYIKFYSRNEELSEKNVCLHELVAEKIAIFQDMAAAQATRIENDIPPSLHISTDAQLLSIIIHNLLDNACKHTPMGLIRFSVKVTQQQIEIMIEDSGKGMDSKIVNWCNSPPGTDAEANNGEHSTSDHQGLGLSIVKELVAILQGKLIVWSEKKIGTTVVIVVAGPYV